MSLLDNLNQAQKKAVTHGEGPMLVVAGAGTGKTRVITERIAWLIAGGKAKPEEILALTFTDKAAGEMLDRLDILIGWEAYRVNVMTFHAFGSQLISRFGHHMGRSVRSELLPETAKLVLLKRHLDEAKLSYYGAQDDIVDFLAGQLEFINTLQNADVSPEAYRDYVEGLRPQEDLHQLDITEAQDRLAVYELYEQIKRRYSVIDYHDQIKLPLELLQERPNLAEKLKNQYRYVLVDEYQDTNAVQDELLRTFVPASGNIFAVGDDDQAIYGFRGARLSNILEFSDHFKLKEPIVLSQNYRSTQGILDSAYRLIQGNNPDRLEAKLGLNKKLHGQKPGSPPQFSGYGTPREEYIGVAAELERLIKSGSEGSELAVLATSHAPLRAMAKVLQSRGLPYALTSSVNIFEQPEVLQLWHLLRWLVLEAEESAVIQLLHGPFIGLSHEQTRLIVDTARRELVSVEAALEKCSDSLPDSQQVISNLDQWRQWAAKVPVSQLIYKLVFETGLSEQWIEQADDEPRLVRVFEDLQLWLRQALIYEHTALDPKLAGYLEMFPRPPEIMTEELTGDEHGVALLTVHAAKGLEFEQVFIINNTVEAWSERGIKGAPELPVELSSERLDLPPEHERRRMLYVAMTRAKSNLTLSAPLETKSGRARKPSPFLQEIFKSEKLVIKKQQKSTNSLDYSLQKIQQFRPATLDYQSDRLPFESPEGWLELTARDLEQYDFCPYEFYLEKVLKIQAPFGPQMAFGNVLHEAFHSYYRSRLEGSPLDLRALKVQLEAGWRDHGYTSAEAAETARRQALKTLENFYKREEKLGRKVRSSEEDFRLVLDEHKLIVKGRMDATFDTEAGLEIRDFKTGRGRDKDKLDAKAKSSLQLRTYALATREMTGRPPARVVLDNVVTGVEGEAVLSERILSNHQAKLGKIADNIRKRKFEPNANSMHKCTAHRYWGSGENE